MYTDDELQQLKEIAEMLQDDQSLGLTQRLIVNDVIRSCREKGISFEEQVKNFVNEGLSRPH